MSITVGFPEKIDLAVSPHQGGKLVMYNLYHQLARLNGVGAPFWPRAFALTVSVNCLATFIVDVGVKKRAGAHP